MMHIKTGLSSFLLSALVCTPVIASTAWKPFASGAKGIFSCDSQSGGCAVVECSNNQFLFGITDSENSDLLPTSAYLLFQPENHPFEIDARHNGISLVGPHARFGEMLELLAKGNTLSVTIVSPTPKQFNFTLSGSAKQIKWLEASCNQRKN